MGKYKKIVEAYQYRKGMNDLNILAFIKCGDYNKLSCLTKSYLEAKFNKGSLYPIRVPIDDNVVILLYDTDYIIRESNLRLTTLSESEFKKQYEAID